MREEGQIKRKIHQTLCRWHTSPIYVDDITYTLECIKRNSHWQEYLSETEIAANELVDIENNEIGIFEVRQEQHTRHNARYDPPFAFSRVFGGGETVANDIIEDCGTHQNHNIIAATFVIEKQAEKCYHKDSGTKQFHSPHCKNFFPYGIF